MATSEEISVDAAVLSELDGVFTFKDENKNSPGGFSCQACVALLLIFALARI